MNTITKKYLIELIEEELLNAGYTYRRNHIKNTFYDFFEYLGHELSTGSTIYISTVGKIYSSIKAAGRPVRNPKTGEPHVMSETISFKFANGTGMTKIKTANKILKSEMLEWLTERLDKPKAAVIFHDIIRNAIISVREEGARIEIRGFGAFSRKTRKARRCRNPKTGEAVETGDKNIIAFKAGKAIMKEAKFLRLGQ